MRAAAEIGDAEVLSPGGPEVLSPGGLEVLSSAGADPENVQVLSPGVWRCSARASGGVQPGCGGMN